MRLRPLHDWVLIKRMEPEERTAGGIIIPASAKEKPSEGVVRAVGPGRYKTEKGKKEKKFIPTVLKPGERVLFVDYKARDIDLNGEEITLVREDDVLGTYGDAGAAEMKASRIEAREEQPPAVEDKTAAPGRKSPEKKVFSVSGSTQGKKTKPKKTAAMRKPEKEPKKAVEKVAKSTAAGKKKEPVPKKSKKTTIPKHPKKLPAKTEKAKRTTATGKTSKKVAAKTIVKKTPGRKVAPKKAVLKKTASKKPAAKKTANKAVKKSVSKIKKRTKE